MNFWVIFNHVRSDDSATVLEGLNTNFLELRARMSELEEKSNELEKRMAEVDPTREIFDCYLTDIWKTNGIITFDGCSVDMTNGDPRRGSFVVVEPGVYRLTFTGYTYYPSSRWGSVYMKVDGEVVAAAKHDVGEDLGTILK